MLIIEFFFFICSIMIKETCLWCSPDEIICSANFLECNRICVNFVVSKLIQSLKIHVLFSRTLVSSEILRFVLRDWSMK